MAPVVFVGAFLSGCAVVEEYKRAMEAHKQREALGRQLSNILLNQSFANRALAADFYQLEDPPHRLRMIYTLVHATGGTTSDVTYCLGPIDVDRDPPAVLTGNPCEAVAWLNEVFRGDTADPRGFQMLPTEKGCEPIVGTLKIPFDRVLGVFKEYLQTNGWEISKITPAKDAEGVDIQAQLPVFRLSARIVKLPSLGDQPLTGVTAKVRFLGSQEEPGCERRVEPSKDQRRPNVRFTRIDALSDGLQLYFTVPEYSVRFRQYQVRVRGGALRYEPGRVVDYPLKGVLLVLLGKGYEQRMTFRDIVRILQKYVDIPFLSLMDRADRLEAELQSAERRLQTAESASDQYRAAKEVRQILEELIQIHTQLRSEEAVVAPYRQRLEAINVQIARVEPQAREEQIQRLQRQVMESVQEEEQIRAVLQQTPRTPEEFDRQRELLARWEAHLQRRQGLLEELRALQALDPETERRFQKSQQALQEVRQRLDREAPRFRLQALERQYGEMQRRRQQLYDQLARVIGTPQEHAVRTQIVDLLRQMVANREEALRLGHKPAGEAVRRLQDELRKLGTVP